MSLGIAGMRIPMRTTAENGLVETGQQEPQFAPEGKTVLQVNVPQFDKEYKYWKGLTRGTI